jgi:hypothetical protein
MDASKQQAIGACGRCGHDERSHQHATGTDEEAILVLAALGGPCPKFVISDAALAYQRHLALASRAPRPGGRRGPICQRCGNRGHPKELCPL